jgi:hypothetical protein
LLSAPQVYYFSLDFKEGQKKLCLLEEVKPRSVSFAIHFSVFS